MTKQQRNITGIVPGRIHHWIRLLLVVAVGVGCLGARAAGFTAALDHDTILLGDTATLSLKFEGGQPQGALQLPELPGLQVVSSGQSSEFGFSNGRSTSSVTYNYGVKAIEVGEFTIPSFNIKLGGEVLSSQPVKFKVVRPSAPAPGSAAEQQALALLRYTVPKKEVYVGETVVLEQQLLLRSGVQSVQGLDIPPLEVAGCAAGKAVQGQQRGTVIGSTSFTLVPFYIPLTVMRAGKITLGPVDGAVVVELPAQRGNRDPFDPFGMFNRGVQQRVSVSSPELTLNAQPLPEQGKPASFSGAVGQFAMDYSIGPSNVAVGDPVTIRIQISGRGALDSFTLPEQSAWKEFKVYPPTVKVETIGDLGLEGTKSFEQVVVPQNTEIKKLPAFEFSYFDPAKGSYETLREDAYPLLVRPSGSTPSPTLAINTAKPEATVQAQDIVHIKPRLGRAVPSSVPLVQQTWFLALQGVPAFVLLGAMFWRRRSDNLTNNPRLRRQRQVEGVVGNGLTQLHRLASEGNSDEFFALVFRLIQEQVGERLDMPASAITEAVVDDKLRECGLPDETADALHELFQQCNQARYAPVQSLQALEAVIPSLESVLAQVREVRS